MDKPQPRTILTPAEARELQALEDLAAKDEARSGVLPFTLYTLPNYKAGWFHRELGAALDQFLSDVLDGLEPRLILTAPPRHGKTELAARRFPAYTLGVNPDLQIIASSYAADLASRTNRDVQRVIDTARYKDLFPQSYLWGKRMPAVAGDTSYTRNTELFEMVGRKGGYRSAGVGGGITGMGADIFLIDDPIKDAEQADSQTYRNKLWEWFTSVAYTRLAPGAGILIIQTRWHEDDLVGRLLELMKAGGEYYELLNFKAIAEEDEPNRIEGEPLHPERYSLDFLNKVKAVQGSYKFGALYQGHPTPAAGQKIKRAWWKYYTVLPAVFDELLQSWDCTFKDSDGSDYVVGQVWGRIGAKFYLIDQKRDRMNLPETVKAMLAMYIQHPEATLKLVEDKANGPAALQTLTELVPGMTAVDPQGGKESRVNAVSPMIEAGNCFLPDPSIAPWITDFVEECAAFPKGTHDDQVDAMTQALMRLAYGLGALYHSVDAAYREMQEATKSGVLDPRFHRTT